MTCPQLTIAALVSQTPDAARRTLVIGESDSAVVLRLARATPSGGLLMCIDGDRDAAARAAAAFAREGVAGRAHVMPGDPALFIRKVSGPFDLIVMFDTPDAAARIEPHLPRLLAPGGRVVRGGQDEGLG